MIVAFTNLTMILAVLLLVLAIAGAVQEAMDTIKAKKKGSINHIQRRFK